MLRRFSHDTRGVSEIVASLTLVLIVSAAGVILYTYSLDTFASTGSSYQQQTSLKEEQARERLVITAVWWDTADQLNVTVLNYGKIEIVIDAVYINGNRVSDYSSGKGTTVGKGELISVEFTSPVSIRDGQTYEITVASKRGNKNVVYWEA
ncbi:MAG: hypothetical protein ACE5OW_07925 [Candidatus Bathyarchaeia archaeon]